MPNSNLVEFRTFRGTGEPLGDNMLTGLLNHALWLPGVVGHDAETISEIAPIGSRTFGQSIRSVEDHVRRLDELGRDWAAAGFSLGAAGLGTAINKVKPKNCIGVILIADPLRHPHQRINDGTRIGAEVFGQTNTGVAGSRLVTGPRTRSYVHPLDPIANASQFHPLRVVSDMLTGYRQNVGMMSIDPIKLMQGISRWGPEGRHTAYGTEFMPGAQRSYIDDAKIVLTAMIEKAQAQGPEQ